MDIDDITYRIRAAIFEVNDELGGGFLEKVYENALMVELKNQGLAARSQVPLKVRFKGAVVGEYVADIVVENCVLMELKATARLDKAHEAQILHYLKATGLKVGLLVNFSGKLADIKRFVRDSE